MDYSKIINPVVLDVPPSGIRKYFDMLTDKTISLGVGEPDFPTPERIRQYALKRLSTGRVPYSSNSGMPELRELISKYMLDRFSLEYDISEILVTVGASQAIDIALRTLIAAGDEVIIPDPGYVAYTPNVLFCGGVPVYLKVEAKDKFKITKEALSKVITPKTKAIIFPYPTNPTGGIMEKEDLEAIAPLLIENNVMVISDEIYAELTYNGKHHVSMASIPGMYERTVILNGFSKAFSMTGWRIGFICAPQPIIAAITKVHQITMLSAPTPAQYAAIGALAQGLEDGYKDMKAMVDEYARRRRYLVDAFNELGLTCNEPEGAFYVFPSIESTGLTCEDFAERLLMEADVCVVPGSAFGESGNGFIRCCYATSMENLVEAIRRIKVFLENLKK